MTRSLQALWHPCFNEEATVAEAVDRVLASLIAEP
jgi:hypothetical protein